MSRNKLCARYHYPYFLFLTFFSHVNNKRIFLRWAIPLNTILTWQQFISISYLNKICKLVIFCLRVLVHIFSNTLCELIQVAAIQPLTATFPSAWFQESFLWIASTLRRVPRYSRYPGACTWCITRHPRSRNDLCECRKVTLAALANTDTDASIKQ